jgi:hypothetical protein
MIRKIAFISFVFLLCACSSKDENIKIPENVIPPEEMVSILVDFHLVEASVIKSQEDNADINQLTNFRYRSILTKHKISRKKLDESIAFYTEHMKEMHKIYEQVVVELSKTQSRIISK